jgi:hypothetical protein
VRASRSRPIVARIGRTIGRVRACGHAGSGVAIAILLACRPNAFACDDASDCSDTPGGVCQPEGYCSFPDETCPSGQRFGEYSGELSNTCVPVHEDDTEVGTASTTATSSSPSSSEGATTVPMTTEPDSDDTTPVVTEGSDTSSSTTDPGTTGPGAESSSGGPMLDPDLALWFTFDDDASDGIANTGTLGGVAECTDLTCPTATTGVLDMAGAFDGVEDCGVIAAGDLLDADAEFTLAAWLRLDAIPTGPVVVLGQAYGDALFNTWDLAVLGDGQAAWLVYEGILDPAGDGVATITSENLSLDAWIHVTVTHASDAIALWINGDLAAQADGFLLVTDQHPLLLGCDDEHLGGYSLFLPGTLDDVRLYERALEADEITDLANP